jgi:outer membrane receptor protein involved in Fe transport
VFAHTGGDVGLSHSWRAGLSYLQTRSEDTQGRTKIGIADFVWKWAPNGNSRETNFKLQGEYFRQEQDERKPSGAYVQGVYQFMPQWRIGARYDWLDDDSKRESVMVDWSPSEFSRVRLQLARSRTQPDFTDNQVFLQYILTLGAHGAHRY